MRYIDVLWIHDSHEYPTRLVSEIGDDGFETRKIDYYRDGRIGYAGTTNEAGDTRLGEAPTPDLEDINADPEFQAVEIDAEQFEELWRAATSHGA